MGGGPGGYAAALYAHNFDLDVTLIEKDRPGGTCLIRGCIPAKQWLQVAEVYHTVASASDFGVVTSQPQLDWEPPCNARTTLSKVWFEVSVGFSRNAASR